MNQDLGLLFTGGYFRTGAEAEFDWRSRGRGVWYALFSSAGGTTQAKGFTSSYAGEAELLAELVKLPVDSHATLVGIWNGQWYTSLFPLQRDVAIARLRENISEYEEEKRKTKADRKAKLEAVAKARRDAETKKRKESLEKREAALFAKNATIIAKVVAAPPVIQKRVIDLIDAAAGSIDIPSTAITFTDGKNQLIIGLNGRGLACMHGERTRALPQRGVLVQVSPRTGYHMSL